MKVSDILLRLEESSSPKAKLIGKLCNEYVKFDDIINLDQNKVHFPKQDKEISMNQVITDAFLCKLASIEFGFNGWIFAGGTHKSITQNTLIEAEKFGELYGYRFGKTITLASGATTKFMEVINRGYNKSGNYAITSTTNFPDIADKVNKEIKYCFTTSTFANMEIFLIHNAIAGVFFEGGIGTTYEAFSMLVERQRGSIPKNTPIIFVRKDKQDHLLFNLINAMQEHGTVYKSDLENLYSVDTAHEALDILSSHDAFKGNLISETNHEFIREIFTVSSDRYI